MTPYRQPIRPLDVGTDVKAVKRALVKAGYGSRLVMNRIAGPEFVSDLKKFQRSHGLPADGVYGPNTHAKVAPLFDKWGVALYKLASIRKPKPKTAAQFAQRLLADMNDGRYHADNSGDLNDIRSVAVGRAVRNRAGQWITIDKRVLEVLCFLIDHGHRIGTFAICSDHSIDGPHGHSGGHAVDISSIDGLSVASSSSRDRVIAVDRLLHAGGVLTPWQLISGGCGYHRDSEISGYSIPGGDWYYGSGTMAEHCNHIHVGYR